MNTVVLREKRAFYGRGEEKPSVQGHAVNPDYS
jgi:hypothetical protein